MKLSISNPTESLTAFLRRASYASHRDPHSQQANFVRRLGAGEYPRFHLYVEAEGESVAFNLHLDQKRPSYSGSHAHAGEYEGQLVREEAARIQSLGRP